jgi:hypothetical protein
MSHHPMNQDQTRRTVILIRPWDMSDGVGAGCCSGGSTKGLCVDPSHHPEQHGTRFIERATWQPLAATYRRLHDDLPDDVDVQIVDPRNHLYLLPVLVSQARRRGLGWWDALTAALRAPGYAAIIVDGVTVSSGRVLEPAEALHAVRRALGLRPV